MSMRPTQHNLSCHHRNACKPKKTKDFKQQKEKQEETKKWEKTINLSEKFLCHEHLKQQSIDDNMYL